MAGRADADGIDTYEDGTAAMSAIEEKQANSAFSVVPAGREHLEAIIAMYADDMLGTARESLEEGERAAYEAAFDRMLADPATTIYVALAGGKPAGTFQITFINGLSHRGMIRAEIEAVRIRADLRGRGLGARMMRFAVELARERGAGVVQLTSNKARIDAHRFYRTLGFKQSHEGFKLSLRD